MADNGMKDLILEGKGNKCMDNRMRESSRRHSKRRYTDYVKTRNKKQFAEKSCRQLTPYVEDGVYRNPGRGKMSSYLKRTSNKKIRKTPGIYKGGKHKRVQEYWRKLI